MDTNTVSFVISVVALLGAAVVPFINGHYARKEAEAERIEQRRKERTEVIAQSNRSLVRLFGRYEAFIQKDEGAFESTILRNAIHARIIGEAIAELLTVNDKDLTEIATLRLTPNMVEEKDNREEFEKYGDFKNRNRNAMIDALQRLGYLLRETITLN